MSENMFYNKESKKWDIEKDVTDFNFGDCDNFFETDFLITRDMFEVIVDAYYKTSGNFTEYSEYIDFQERIAKNTLFTSMRFPAKEDIVFVHGRAYFPQEFYDDEVRKFWLGEILVALNQIEIDRDEIEDPLGNPFLKDEIIDKLILCSQGIEEDEFEDESEFSKKNRTILSKEMNAIVGDKYSPIFNDVEEI
jgi:hypothetical protein